MFIILLFRALFLYEIADQKHTGLKRLMLVTPVCLMLIGNLAGVVASFTSPSHSSKKRLKVSEGIPHGDSLVLNAPFPYNEEYALPLPSGHPKL